MPAASGRSGIISAGQPFAGHRRMIVMKVCIPALAAILFVFAHVAFAGDDSSSRIAVVYVHPDGFTDASNRDRASGTVTRRVSICASGSPG
jgi:hypothetical protein